MYKKVFELLNELGHDELIKISKVLIEIGEKNLDIEVIINGALQMYFNKYGTEKIYG